MLDVPAAAVALAVLLALTVAGAVVFTVVLLVAIVVSISGASVLGGVHLLAWLSVLRSRVRPQRRARALRAAAVIPAQQLSRARRAPREQHTQRVA